MNKAERDPLTEKIIGLALEVHRELGPGLFESAYSECLAYEISVAGIPFLREFPVPVKYKAVSLDCGYRLDFLVDQKLVLEVKAVEQLMAIHSAQLLTHLKMTKKKVGLLLNFNETLLKNGLIRKVM